MFGNGHPLGTLQDIVHYLKQMILVLQKGLTELKKVVPSYVLLSIATGMILKVSYL